ncbi:cardiolipin synthase [Desulfosediminicola ganghwensis]|uniref:cardiolipin synthase n=1 Tax=Desulfosediminicola ganghwensis TaxID=2569540 RepID=UPI0010AC017B|nr:cardiolipin synthase [Desulfosediminicola ganghwensis]
MIKRTRDFLRKSTYLSLFFLCLHIAGLVSSIDAVMSVRTSQGAIAWVISLNTFPSISLPAYWVFGRSEFKGYVISRQADETALSAVAAKAAENKSYFVSGLADRNQASRVAESLADLPHLKENSTELLIDGEATFESIFGGIEKARDYVLVQFFIVKDDELGRRLQDLLIKKAQEGVRVFFLYDEVGSYKLPEAYIQELRDNGVAAHNFHSRKGPKNRFQINFRNHRKIVVADGKTCWIGGHNVGDEYLGNGEKFSHWRDTHVKIEGPATLAAQLSFIEDWHWATDEVLELNWKAVPSTDADQRILIIPSGPADRFETAGLMFTHAINSARERIWIASPYFVPDESIIAALQLAGMRGVDVRILIPDEPDHKLVYLAAFSYFEQAGMSGVKFYRYTKGFMHQKTMLVDNDLSTVGTANFDNRSFRLNFEITAMITDQDFNKEVEQMFLEDFANSRLMEPDEAAEKPFWFKLLVRVARLTSPML